jgi:hypothetical protein
MHSQDDSLVLTGKKVNIVKEGRTIRTGYVDAVTETADAVWLEGHRPDQRALFEKAQGYTVQLLRNGENE